MPLPSDVDRICARDGCSQQLVHKGSRGRLPKFCSVSCRNRQYRQDHLKEFRERDRDRSRDRYAQGYKRPGQSRICAGGCGRRVEYRPDAGSLEQPTCQPCRRKRRESVQLICEHCQELFDRFWGPAQALPRFCSKSCATASRKTAARVRVCEWCQEEYRYGTKGQRFCSLDCRDLARRETTNAWPRRLIWHVNCAECTRLFVARTSNQLLCSPDCRRAYNSRKVSERIMTRYRADPAFRALMLSKSQNRRVSRLGLEGITQPANLLAWLYERDNGLCGICGEEVIELDGPMKPSIDHIIPLSRGGLHVPANLWLAHYRCNLEKHNKMPDPEVVATVRLAVQMAS